MTAPVPINHVGPTFPIIQVSNSRRSWTLLTRVGRLSMGKIRTLKGAQKNPGKPADFGKRDTANSSRNVLSSFERIVRVTKHGDMVLVMLCWSLIHWSFYSNVGVLAFSCWKDIAEHKYARETPCTLFLNIADSAQTEYCPTFHCSSVRVSQAWHLTFLTYIKA